jgi:hypothetical protein
MSTIKRVLFLAHPESDYGGSYLYSGLCRVLGAENVTVFPEKLSYHGETHLYPRPWHNNEEGQTAPLPFLAEPFLTVEQARENAAHTNTDTIEGLRAGLLTGFFDAVILESWRPQIQQVFIALQDAITVSGVPVVLHDGEDYSEFNHQALQATLPTLYLKREMPREGRDAHNLIWRDAEGNFTGHETFVVPFPFSVPDNVVAFGEQKREEAKRANGGKLPFSVSFLCGRSHGYRDEVRDALLSGLPLEIQASAIIATNDPPERSLHEMTVHPLLPFWQYIETMALSTCAVSVRGHGWDTCRFWEAGAVTGLIADVPGIHLPNQPRQLEHCMYFKDPKQAVARIEIALSTQPEWDELTERGRAHMKQYHTNSARARYLLDMLARWKEHKKSG